MIRALSILILLIALADLVVMAVLKSASDADDAIEAMPDLFAEREARVTKAKELVLENKG